MGDEEEIVTIRITTGRRKAPKVEVQSQPVVPEITSPSPEPAPQSVPKPEPPRTPPLPYFTGTDTLGHTYFPSSIPGPHQLPPASEKTSVSEDYSTRPQVEVLDKNAPDPFAKKIHPHEGYKRVFKRFRDKGLEKDFPISSAWHGWVAKIIRREDSLNRSIESMTKEAIEKYDDARHPLYIEQEVGPEEIAFVMERLEPYIRSNDDYQEIVEKSLDYELWARKYLVDASMGIAAWKARSEKVSTNTLYEFLVRGNALLHLGKFAAIQYKLGKSHLHELDHSETKMATLEDILVSLWDNEPNRENLEYGIGMLFLPFVANAFADKHPLDYIMEHTIGGFKQALDHLGVDKEGGTVKEIQGKVESAVQTTHAIVESAHTEINILEGLDKNNDLKRRVYAPIVRFVQHNWPTYNKYASFLVRMFGGMVGQDIWTTTSAAQSVIVDALGGVIKENRTDVYHFAEQRLEKMKGGR